MTIKLSADAIRSAITQSANASGVARGLLQFAFQSQAFGIMLAGIEASISDAGENSGKRSVQVRALLAKVKRVGIDPEGAPTLEPARLSIIELARTGETDKYEVIQTGSAYALVYKLVSRTETLAEKLSKLLAQVGKADADERAGVYALILSTASALRTAGAVTTDEEHEEEAVEA